MKKIKIFENNEKEQDKKVLIHQMIAQTTNKFLKIKYNKIIIYLNLIIIYCFLYKFYKCFDKIYKLATNLKKNNSINYSFSENKSIDLIINKYKRTSIEWPLSKDIKFKPFMSENEI